ncbi:alpha/beta hydrolase [Micromonospora sp. NPDC000663]|uniref:alpha/beta hydrolase n=1 Tax=Micromonospora sp. NPDC000663 TaxID=3364218 RepID=UPI0036A46164
MTKATPTGDTMLSSIDGLLLDAEIQQPSLAERRGTVIYAHGITADKDEFGFAATVADQLLRAGFSTLRFSFRGHGRSEGTQRGVTIAGELLDLQAAVNYAVAKLDGPLSVVASSFGAVSTLLSLPWLDERLHRLVLLRPVLDLRRTFVEPETPWGIEHYSPGRRTLLDQQGFLLINGTFELGRTMFEEIKHYDPVAPFLASTVPTLIVQGDRDSIVSYEVARQTADRRVGCRLHTVTGADHGFDDHQEEAVEAVVSWLRMPFPLTWEGHAAIDPQ